MTLVRAIPPIRGKRGRPLQKPVSLLADRGYDSEPHRRQLRDRGIEPVIARRNTEHGSGLGVYRYVVEQTISILHRHRRLLIRYEKRSDIHDAFLKAGCIVTCWRRLESSLC